MAENDTLGENALTRLRGEGSQDVIPGVEAASGIKGNLRRFFDRINIIQAAADAIGREVFGITPIKSLEYRLKELFTTDDFVKIWTDKDGTKLQIEFVLATGESTGQKITIIIRPDNRTIAEYSGMDTLDIDKKSSHQRKGGGVLSISEVESRIPEFVATIKDMAVDPRLHPTEIKRSGHSMISRQLF